jgi:hypothetical protein
VAKTLKPFPSSHHIAVNARIVWAVDGEETVPATAIASTRHYVKLSCPDRRLQVPYVRLARPTFVDERPATMRLAELVDPVADVELCHHNHLADAKIR